jgi:NCS1 family nucleobase:cation symporter-1
MTKHPGADAGTDYAPLSPVPEARRVFRTRDAFALWLSLGIGLLVLQAGALLVPGLSLPHALAAIVVGTTIGVALLSAAGVIGADTGLASMSALRAPLGVRGATLPAVLNAVQLIGWGVFEIVVMRDAAAALAQRYLGAAHPLFWTVAFGALATLLAVLGPLSFVRRFLRSYGLWLLCAGAVWMTWNLLVHLDLGALARRPGNGSLAFGAAVDLVVAMPMSWLPLIADYTRFGKRPGEMFRGSAAGYALANVWFYALGAAYGLAAGGDTMLTSALAATGGGVALLLVLIDETDNAFADLHSAAVSASTAAPRLRVAGASLALGALCTVLALVVPIDRYQNFLLLIGSVFAPLFGVVLTDHFLVRRRRVAVHALDDLDGPYGYSNGWHLSALLCWAVGIAAYHAINQWLPQVGATLPALAVSAACYYLALAVRRPLAA